MTEVDPELEAAARRVFNRIFEDHEELEQRIARLLELSELDEANDLGTKLAADVIELGPVEELGRLREVSGIGPLRYQRLVEALARAERARAESATSESAPAEDAAANEGSESPTPEAAANEPPPAEEPPPVDEAAANEPPPQQRAPIDRQRSEQAEQLIRRHSLGAGAIGLIPLPLVDMTGLVAVQLNLLRGLAELYQVEFSAQLGRSLITALLGSATAMGSARLLRSLPLLGLLGAPAATAAATYAFGRLLVSHFEAGGTLASLDPAAVRQAYERALDRSRPIVAGG